MSRTLDGGSPERERADELDPYDGQWVAMRDGRVVAHGLDEETVREHEAVEPTDLVFPVGVPPSGFYLINV